MHPSEPSIVLIGAGNLASHLAPALKLAGYTFLQVMSRSDESAKALAATLKCNSTTDPLALEQNAGLYLFCLKDDCIEQAVSVTDPYGKLLVHTSGSTSIDLLKKYSPRCAVLYPLQTFSKGHSVELADVPFLVEGSGEEEVATITGMASALSRSVHRMDSGQRLLLHLAAVIASNFSNHMYAKAKELLDAEGLSFDMLKPLILKTAQKIQYMDPALAQTGPAIRNDQSILDRHTEMLEEFPAIKNIYTFVSKSIINGQR